MSSLPRSRSAELGNTGLAMAAVSPALRYGASPNDSLHQQLQHPQRAFRFMRLRARVSAKPKGVAAVGAVAAGRQSTRHSTQCEGVGRNSWQLGCNIGMGLTHRFYFPGRKNWLDTKNGDLIGYFEHFSFSTNKPGATPSKTWRKWQAKRLNPA